MGRDPEDMALPSPCISVCQLDKESGLCLGCFRTGGEIAAWRSMSPAEQHDLLTKLRDRRASMTGIARREPRRRRRRNRLSREKGIRRKTEA